MSSVEVYKKNTKKPINEKSALLNIVDVDTYGYAASKIVSESAASLFIKQHGIDILTVRAGNVYGPGDRVTSEKGRVIPSFVMKAINRKNLEIWGSGMYSTAFIFVSDFVKSALNFVELAKNISTINIVGSNQITLEDLAKTIIKKTNSKSKVKIVNPAIKKIYSPTFSNKKAQKMGIIVESVSLDEGLIDTIKYLMNEK